MGGRGSDTRHIFGAMWAVCLTLACSAPSDPPARTEVAAVMGTRLDIILSTDGDGQFGEPLISLPIVRLLESSIVPPQAGEELRQRYRFETLATGRTDVRFPHSMFDDAWIVIAVSP
jgi:hypothetical protein